MKFKLKKTIYLETDYGETWDDVSPKDLNPHYEGKYGVNYTSIRKGTTLIMIEDAYDDYGYNVVLVPRSKRTWIGFDSVKDIEDMTHWFERIDYEEVER